VLQPVMVMMRLLIKSEQNLPSAQQVLKGHTS